MTYIQIAYAHLATVVPAALIGTLLIFMRKGTPLHKSLGRVYLCLMGITAAISLTMPARVGPQFLGHFGFIHLLSLLVLYTVIQGYLAAKRGDIRTHRRSMTGMYIGGIVLAGLFTLMPGRMLHQVLFG